MIKGKRKLLSYKREIYTPLSLVDEITLDRLKNGPKESDSDSVWVDVAYHTLASKVRGKLLTHDDPKVRRSLARNPSLTTEELAILVNDKDELVQLLVTRHPGITSQLEQRIARFGSLIAKRALALKCKSFWVMESLASTEDEMIIENLTLNPKVDSKLLDKWTEYPNLMVRRQIAIHQNASSEILHRLTCDPDSKVRRKIFYNPGKYPDVIRVMVKDSDPTIADQAKDWLRIRGIPE